jgi:hypothetical protein
MHRDLFHDRGRAEEAVHFHKQDEILLERLRQRAKLNEIAKALAEKLHEDKNALLERIARLGVTVDTGAAFILAPLIEIAWADGDISHAERAVIHRIATERGVVPGSPDMQQINRWLETRPSDDLFETALEAIKVGLSVLPPDEREQRVKDLISTCKQVANATASLRQLLRRRQSAKKQKRSVLDEINHHLATAGQG